MKQFRPVREGLVRCYDRTGLLIPVGNESEKQIALLPVYGGIPNLIYDDQGGLVIASTLARTPRFMIFPQLLNQVLHVRRIDADACLTGF